MFFKPKYIRPKFRSKIEYLLLSASSIKYDCNNADFSLLKEKEELNLIKLMINFPSLIEGAVISDEAHRLTTYLQDLASDFHSFYNKHKVITDDDNLSVARLALVDAMRIVFGNGLNLLGISPMETM